MVPAAKWKTLLRRVLQEAGRALLALSTQCFLHHKNSVSAIVTTNFTPLLLKQLPCLYMFLERVYNPPVCTIQCGTCFKPHGRHMTRSTWWSPLVTAKCHVCLRKVQPLWTLVHPSTTVIQEGGWTSRGKSQEKRYMRHHYKGTSPELSVPYVLN